MYIEETACNLQCIQIRNRKLYLNSNLTLPINNHILLLNFVIIPVRPQRLNELGELRSTVNPNRGAERTICP